ncbi:PREDICTED: TMV resistance protein N-like [Fragaria vesca subsp. vesca]
MAAPDLLPQQKYDVFLSFRGEDTRQAFTSHLYDALQRKKIRTFIDDKLERGDSIEPSLVKEIKQSKLSVIIFSENYAFSRWCLDELWHILDCKERNGQFVIPVFHNIDPSHVRKQQGSYKDAFAYLSGRFEDNKVSMWRQAVTTTANLSGFTSQDIRPESKLVETIVNDISKKLSRYSSIDLKGYVGLEPHIQQIESLLCMHNQDVHFRTIGIWGMGGIGKTIIADAVFQKFSTQFHACSFLPKVTEKSEKDGLDHLRNKLLCDLLDEKNVTIDTPSIGSVVVKDRLSRTRVLIVLDDVSESRHLDFLPGDQVQFGAGSRVIITTRNRCILKEMVDDDHVYRVMKLDSPDDLKLFQLKAFKENSSREAYSDLSREVVDYAKGIPLVLTVLGSTFRHCNSIEEWGDELKKLKKFPNKTIHDVLRLSYNRLEDNEKGIFLDIACYLKGENICDAKRILEIHGFCASRGISLLIYMSLISISKDNRLEMHDLVQAMGWLIVREQCIEEPGNRSRLRNEDAYRVLKNNTGTAKVEAMFLEMSSIPELQLSPAAFRDMYNLKLLKIWASEKNSSWRNMNTEEQQLVSFPLLHGAKRLLSFFAKSKNCSYLLQESHNFLRSFIGTKSLENLDGGSQNSSRSLVDLLPEGLESLPELGYLQWDGYPWKSLPSKFSPINLVELNMPGSAVERLWNKGQNLENLKRMNLRYCKHLIEVPDLSRCLNIETVDLLHCESLDELPSYFKTLDKLTHLNLGWCSQLKTLPEIPCNVSYLRLSGTAIQDIPTSIWSHKKLDLLGLSYCKNLKNLTSTAWKLNLHGGDQHRIGPRELHLFECKNLDSLPDSIYCLNRLEKLNLISCKQLKRLPPLSVGSCSLTSINLSGCNLLEVPDGLIGLSSLQDIHLSGTLIESIPENIKHACRLRKLHLKNCKKLQSIPELPLLLRVVDADNCTSLKTVARSTLKPQRWDHQDVGGLNHCPVQERLVFSNCFELDESSRSSIMSDAVLRIRRLSSLCDGADSKIQKLIVISAGNVIPDWFSYQAEGCQIDVKFPPHWFDTANFLGFAVSVVFGLNNFDDDDNGFSMTCKCSFKTCHGDDYEYSYKLPWVQCTIPESVQSDQVLALFNKDTFWLEGNKRRSTPIPLDKVTEASFHFYQEATSYENLEKLKVKKCGIQMLYSHV